MAQLCTHRLLSSKEVLDFITQICSIIRYLHGLSSAVLHLDIKPENIIISEGRARLIDFGSADRLKSGRSCDSLSRGYAAPEQEAALAVDCGTDIYALGRLLDFMLTHSSASGDARTGLKRIAQRCCERKPWKRISSAKIMLKMLNKRRKTETKEKDASWESSRSSTAGGVKIGVVGLGPRCGTTHIAIALANCLADVRGWEVCLTERSDRSDLAKLPAIRRETEEGRGPAEIGGVTYLTSGYAYDREIGAGDRFDAVVYDLGCNAAKAEKMLSRCDIEIAVAGAAPWREKERESCRGSVAAVDNSGETGTDTERVLFINPADERMMKELRGTGIAMLPFPFEPDPMNPGKETVKVIERAIR